MTNGNTSLPSLSRLFKLSTEQASRDLALKESQRAISQRSRIDQALSGIDLDDRGAVTSALQGIAPQRAAKFAQETREQPEEDFKFALFMTRKLAGVLEQVEDQSDFDQAKKLAADLGIPQKEIDKLGDQFDADTVKKTARLLRGLNAKDLKKEVEKFGPAQQVPGAPTGTIAQPSLTSGKFATPLAKPAKPGKPAKRGFTPIVKNTRFGIETLEQTNQDTGRTIVKFKPAGKGKTNSRGLTDGESRNIAAIIGKLFGGIWDQKTQEFAFRSKDQQLRVLKMQARAERIFASNPKILPAEAVEQARKELEPQEGEGGAQKDRRQRVEQPGGPLEDVGT